MPLFSRSALLDWLYPPACALCETPLRKGSHLCPSCRDQLPALPANSCTTCGQTFDGQMSAPSYCSNCANLKPAFDFATAAIKSNEEAIALIHHFKLRKHIELGQDLAQIGVQAFRQNTRLQAMTSPILIPVPLHGGRLRSRRFNQAEILSRALSEALELPHLKALKRVRPTPRQATLTRKDRLKNLHKAFELATEPSPLEGKNLVLIDDVLTTGSTAHQCSRVLRQAKPANIAVFTIVRA